MDGQESQEDPTKTVKVTEDQKSILHSYYEDLHMISTKQHDLMSRCQAETGLPLTYIKNWIGNANARQKGTRKGGNDYQPAGKPRRISGYNLFCSENKVPAVVRAQGMSAQNGWWPQEWNRLSDSEQDEYNSRAAAINSKDATEALIGDDMYHRRKFLLRKLANVCGELETAGIHMAAFGVQESVENLSGCPLGLQFLKSRRLQTNRLCTQLRNYLQYAKLQQNTTGVVQEGVAVPQQPPTQNIQQPAVAPAPLVQQPVIAPAPLVQQPAVAPAPLVQQPAVAPAPLVQQPVIAPAPLVQQPAVAPAPLVQQPVIAPAPLVQQPAVAPAPLVQQPVIAPAPLVQQPAVAPAPLVQQPAVAPAPLVQQPVIAPAPLVQQPVIAPAPALHQPAVAPTLVFQHAVTVPTPLVQWAAKGPSAVLRQPVQTPAPQAPQLARPPALLSQQPALAPAPMLQQPPIVPTQMLQQVAKAPAAVPQQAAVAPAPLLQQVAKAPAAVPQQAAVAPAPLVQQVLKAPAQLTTSPAQMEYIPLQPVPEQTAFQILLPMSNGAAIDSIDEALGAHLAGTIDTPENIEELLTSGIIQNVSEDVNEASGTSSLVANTTSRFTKPGTIRKGARGKKRKRKADPLLGKEVSHLWDVEDEEGRPGTKWYKGEVVERNGEIYKIKYEDKTDLVPLTNSFLKKSIKAEMLFIL